MNHNPDDLPSPRRARPQLFGEPTAAKRDADFQPSILSAIDEGPPALTGGRGRKLRVAALSITGAAGVALAVALVIRFGVLEDSSRLPAVPLADGRVQLDRAVSAYRAASAPDAPSLPSSRVVIAAADAEVHAMPAATAQQSAAAIESVEPAVSVVAAASTAAVVSAPAASQVAHATLARRHAKPPAAKSSAHRDVRVARAGVSHHAKGQGKGTGHRPAVASAKPTVSPATAKDPDVRYLAAVLPFYVGQQELVADPASSGGEADCKPSDGKPAGGCRGKNCDAQGKKRPPAACAGH